MREEVSVPSALAPEDAVKEIYFAVHGSGDTIHIHATMFPDEILIDTDEADFPDLECSVSRESFKRVVKMFLRADEQL